MPPISNQPSRWLSSLVFLLGFATYLPVGSTYLVMLALLPLAIARIRTNWPSRHTLWVVALCLLLLWPLTSWVFKHSVHFTDRYLHSVRLAICLAIALVLNSNEQRMLLRGFLWGSGAAIAVVMTHNLFIPLPKWVIWHQLLSVSGNGSSQKWIMLATVPAAALLLVPHIRLAQAKWLLILLAVLALFSVLAFSISRNSHLVAVFSVFFALVYTYRSGKIWVAALALVCILALLAFTASDAVHDRALLLTQELSDFLSSGRFDSSVGVRAKMYWTAAQTMHEHWFLGSGLGSWQSVWQAASQPFPDTSGVNNPHNDFLLWGMETGIPGLLTLVLIFFITLKTSWANKNPIAAIGWLMTWTLLLTALVNAPFRDAALGMSLTLLAVALSGHQTADG